MRVYVLRVHVRVLVWLRVCPGAVTEGRLTSLAMRRVAKMVCREGKRKGGVTGIIF